MKSEDQYRYNLNITEHSFFNASNKTRSSFKRKFLKKATKTPDLVLPLKDFDLNKGRNRGLERLEKTKERILASSAEIELLLKQKTLDSEEWKLYKRKNEENLLRIKLIETAHAIQTKKRRKDRAEFCRLNTQLYGQIDQKLFNGLITSKKYNLEKFIPKNEMAKNFKTFLLKSRPFCLYPARFRNEEPRAVFEKINSLLRKTYPSFFSKLKYDDRIYSAEETKILFEKFMKDLNFSWRVVVSDKVSVVTDSVSDHTLKIPKDFSRTAKEVRRLAVHEIGVHTARAINGQRNGGPLLEHGTADYLRAEEGLATLCECSVDESFKNKSYERIIYRYLTAGLALGADGKKRNAVEVLNIIAPLLAIENSENGVITPETLDFAFNEAYRHIENAFRGTDWETRGCVYLKLKIYYEGLIENVRYFSKNIDHIEDAFRLAMLGKYNHTSLKSCKDALFLISLKK